jgi:hypothetical protein
MRFDDNTNYNVIHINFLIVAQIENKKANLPQNTNL